MKFHSTKLEGSYLVELEPVQDIRGWFARYYSKEEFEKIGHKKEWVQMNHSFTNKKGSVRGMHYQLKPHAEIKLVRCISGAVFDVIIDLRESSSGFLNWFGTELSASNKKMLYIPEGFAHGFQCLTDNCELLYHHTGFYKPSSEAGVHYNDPTINIEWPMAVSVISDRDAKLPLLANDFKGL